MPKAKKPAAAKSGNPTSSVMVKAAIEGLKERKGSSLVAIKKYIATNYKIDPSKHSHFIKKALTSGVEKKTIVQTKGTGASGSFKLAKVEVKKPVKKAVKAKTPKQNTRIVGGYEAVPHSFPWMAALFVDEQWFCGGTLISDEWVLTAAHCANGASSMRIMLGAHNVREDTEEGRIEVVTTDFFTHPGWSQFNLHNDLALVHLPYALNFTENIRPVCLPGHSEAGTAWDGEEAVASGWGKPTDSSTSISPTLRWVETDTISNTACWIEFPTAVNKNVICISGAHGKSTCNGDSGGPLYLHNHSASFGSSLGCEIGFHAAFTRSAGSKKTIQCQTNHQ